MHVILREQIDSLKANQFHTTATISNGESTIERVIYFESDSKDEDAVTITSLATFPQKNSAHPRHPSYKYYGNATIDPIDSTGRYWQAVLQYSTSRPNATTSSGGKVTSDTKPWELGPDRIDFASPETTIPFELAYDESGSLSVPVVNSAGDIIPATRSASNFQMSFTFATKRWDENNSIDYGNTINSSSINVCGIRIQKGQGLLKPPSASYITVYEDGSNKVKWEYWSVDVTIVFDIQGNIFQRKFLNVGDRAKFKSLSLSGDDLLTAAGMGSVNIQETSNPSQICRFRKCKKFTFGQKNSYLPVGDIVFCSWEQYITARQAYLDASSTLINSGALDSLYELQCEQEKQMPLDKDGYIDISAIETKKYLIKEYPAYSLKSWSSLNFPSKGIK
jgi:hypothetical protein